MPMIRKSVSVPAGGIENLLQGTKYDRMPRAGAVIVHAVQDGSQGDLLLDSTYQNAIDADGVEIPEASAAGKGPILSGEDVVTRGAAVMGDLVQLKVSNTTALPVDLRYAVEFRYA